MTSPSPFARRPAPQPTLPRGEVVGTYETYPEAQQVVDRLAKADVDVSKVSIVGSDLKTVERVTGKLTWGRAAGAGAASGAWFGLFLGILLVLFSPSVGLGYVLAAILIGAGFGMLFGLVSYTVGRRNRDFTSTHQVLASNYQVIIAPDLLLRAQDVLGGPDAA
ncbi:hypothetical protein QT381_14595 [Galbitalea sp. SE-J8]|uniref:general stress protein n=1 Tax=Galbitalea sp. SE-J8 TaxID=3054952 RepID=UPI00259CBDA7|nr:general stress protein [Galbitalea sp. SE-J8]MDM4764235.1 hypothetical protein [Galbitalea sp. SE-J8]